MIDGVERRADAETDLGQSLTAPRKPWATPHIIASIDARSAKVKNILQTPDSHGAPSSTYS